MAILIMYVFPTRGRKALEQRSMADEERIDFLEQHLKEAKYIAEDADHKYDEVNSCLGWVFACDTPV